MLTRNHEFVTWFTEIIVPRSSCINVDMVKRINIHVNYTQATLFIKSFTYKLTFKKLQVPKDSSCIRRIKVASKKLLNTGQQQCSTEADGRANVWLAVC